MSGPDVEAAAQLLRERLPVEPRVALVLGSGLGALVDGVEGAVEVPFADAPGFPSTGVVGHAGRWVGGWLAGVPALVQAGRYHVYEGHAEGVVAAPVRVAVALGVEVLVVTNAAGGADRSLEPGDVVLLDDHVNLMFRSPLAGPVHAGEARFPDMSAPYDPELQALAVDVARRLGVSLRRGVYAAVTGPSFETAAEVRMLERLGVDVVGMSTVPEVIVARAAGVRCLGFSMVTNKGTGHAAEPLAHADVVEVGKRAGRVVGAVVGSVLEALAAGQATGVK